MCISTAKKKKKIDMQIIIKYQARKFHSLLLFVCLFCYDSEVIRFGKALRDELRIYPICLMTTGPVVYIKIPLPTDIVAVSGFCHILYYRYKL